MRFNPYDDVKNATTLKAQSVSGSSAVNGAAVDTLGADSAKLRVAAVAASGSPTGASLAVKVQESADGSTGWTDALDNTGVAIGFTLTTTSADAENEARIEGLNTNRQRYLRAVVTPTFAGGSSPASLVYAEIVLGLQNPKPVNTATSNT